MTPQQIQLVNRALTLLAAFLVGHGLMSQSYSSEFVSLAQQGVGAALWLFSLFLRKRLQQHKVATALELPEGSTPSDLKAALTAKLSSAGFAGGLKKVLEHPATQSAMRVIASGGNRPELRAPETNYDQKLVARLESVEADLGQFVRHISLLSRNDAVLVARVGELERSFLITKPAAAAPTEAKES